MSIYLFIRFVYQTCAVFQGLPGKAGGLKGEKGERGESVVS
jgi:hypothetical protein